MIIFLGEFICDHCFQVDRCLGMNNQTQAHLKATVGNGILNLKQCQIIRRRNGRRYPICTITGNSKSDHCLVNDMIFPDDLFYATCPLDEELQEDLDIPNQLDVTSGSLSFNVTNYCNNG